MTSYQYYGYGLRGGRGATGADTVSEHIHGGIASGYASNISIGDPVAIVAGKVQQPALTGGVITAFDAVFKGVTFDIASPVDRRFIGSWTGGTALKSGSDAWVYIEGRTDKQQLFSVVTDGPIASTAVGQKANLNPAAGNVLNGTSQVTLNVASIGTGAAVIIEAIEEGPFSRPTDTSTGAASATVKVLVRNANVTA